MSSPSFAAGGAAAATKPFAPKTVIALDFGTAACGYCFAISNGPSPVNARVLPFKPADRASQATEKNLTAILLDAATLRIVAFGREARRRFFDMDPAEQRAHAFLSQFKMALSPTLAATPLHERTVHAEGADIAIPLLTAISKVLEFIREEAMDRAASIGLSPADIGWVLTVPAIWDDPAKAFMRRAAFEAGMTPELDSERLSLALEPEGAIISSAMDAPPDVRASLRVGARVMVLDCGGGTVDCTVSEILSNDPPKLREILAPSGGSWGGTNVDAEFRKFVNDVILSGAGAGGSGGGGGGEGGAAAAAAASDKHADAAASAAALDAWESAKCGWDPADPAHDKVIVSGLATVCEFVGGPEELARRVEAYNAARSLSGAGAVVYRPRSFSLVLPTAVVRAFFDACVEPICGHMQKLLVESAEKRKPVSFVFLVGGFAESLYLQRSVREALQTEDGLAATLMIPAKPVQCVNRGAAVWGLYPSSFISSRVSKMTVAVSLCERYNPAVHDPIPHESYLVTNSSGTWVDNVLVPLIQLNDDIPVDFVVGQEVCPLRDGQSVVNFNIYRLNRRLPPIQAGVPRTYVITDSVAKQLPPAMLAEHVLASSSSAKLSVNVGGGEAALARASVSLLFGRTEVTAMAHSITTGDRKKVQINWDAGATALRSS